MKLSKPEKRIIEKGITYLVRTSDQVEGDLQKLIAKSPRRAADEGFKSHWRKLLSAKIPVCPVCGEHGGPIRRTIEGEILGCDSCLNIAGYYNPPEEDTLVGVREAAEILGWDPRRVATYRSRGTFPEPFEELAMGPVWYRSQIEEYKKYF